MKNLLAFSYNDKINTIHSSTTIPFFYGYIDDKQKKSQKP